MRTPSLPLTLADEALDARADGALHWPRSRTAFVADLHLGKAATFRRFGIPVPERAADDLARLDRLIGETAIDRLVILGDLFHARLGLTAHVLDALHAWRASHAQLGILLVRGNHDRSAGDPAPALDIETHDAPHPLAPFALLHEPDVDAPDAAHALAGHVHPAVRLKDPATRAALRLRCFHVSAGLTILPAFGSFTGAKIVRPAPGDSVLALTPGDTISEVTRAAR